MFKHIFHGKEAFIFDLDGTLADTKPLWSAACAEVASNLDIDWRGDNFLGGSGLEETWEQFLETALIEPPVSIDILVKQTKDKFLKLLEDSDLEAKDGFYPFAFYLRESRNAKIALVTNTDKEVALKVLEKLHARALFDLCLFGDDVKNKKPHPEIYNLAVEKLSAKKRKTLVFEDSPEGVKAALKANLDVVCLWDSYSPPKKDYPSEIELYVEDFSLFLLNMDTSYQEALEEALEKESLSTNGEVAVKQIPKA